MDHILKTIKKQEEEAAKKVSDKTVAEPEKKTEKSKKQPTIQPATKTSVKTRQLQSRRKKLRKVKNNQRFNLPRKHRSRRALGRREKSQSLRNLKQITRRSQRRRTILSLLKQRLRKLLLKSQSENLK